VRANQRRELLRKFERKFSVDGNKGVPDRSSPHTIQPSSRALSFAACQRGYAAMRPASGAVAKFSKLCQVPARVPVAVRLWLAPEPEEMPRQQGSSAASVSVGPLPVRWRQSQPAAMAAAPSVIRATIRPAATVVDPAVAARSGIPSVRDRRWRMASRPSRRPSPKTAQRPALRPRWRPSKAIAFSWTSSSLPLCLQFGTLHGDKAPAATLSDAREGEGPMKMRSLLRARKSGRVLIDTVPLLTPSLSCRGDHQQRVLPRRYQYC